MIFFIGAFFIALVLLIWIWKGPVTKMVTSLKEGGSTAFEASLVVFILVGGSAGVVYMIWTVI